jgi:hypothetical protein
MGDPKVMRDTSMLRNYEASNPFEETKAESDRKSFNYSGNCFIRRFWV